MKFGTLFIALLLAGSTAQAQIPTPTPEAGPWSLDDCIRYAHEHNIQIQQQALQVEQRSVELNTSRHSRLPDLGANLGTNFSFGRSLISNNTYADNNQVSGSLGVSASLPVFMGGRINHEIAAGKLSLKAAAQDLDRIREDVSVNIMSYYLDVLVAKELVDVAEQALALSTQQVERSREQVRTGKVAESVLYENEALLATNELGKDKFEIVTPSESILAEPTVSVVDKVVEAKGTGAVAKEYLDYLWSKPAQELAASLYLRPSNPEVLAANKDKFPEMETFRANDVFGSWDDIMKKFFKDGGVFDEVNKK